MRNITIEVSEEDQDNVRKKDIFKPCEQFA